MSVPLDVLSRPRATGRRVEGHRRHGALVAALLVTLALVAGCGSAAEFRSSQAPVVEGAAVRPVSAPVSDAAARTTAARPNIVMIMADDMRADDLRFAPHLRTLVAKQGISFSNAFSPYPLCCPARASFLTGRYAHNHGVLWHTAPYGFGSINDSTTIATSLQAAGYRTMFIGKYLNGYGVQRSRVTGKASYKYVPRGWHDWYASFQNPRVKRIHGDTYNYFDSPYNINGRVRNSFRGKYQTNVLGKFATKLTRKHANRPGPFFMWLSFLAPHVGSPSERGDPNWVRNNAGERVLYDTPARPRWVRGKFDRMVTRSPGLPANGGPAEADVSDKPGFIRGRPEFNAAERTALVKVTRQRAEAIYVMDQQIGRLIATLKSTGQWESTVLMFTSDNGYLLGEHRIPYGKVKVHEPSLRVPFLVTGPGLRSGTTRHDPITTVDATATILEIARARPPFAPDGVSRWSTIVHGDRGWTAPVVTEGMYTTSGAAPGFTDARSHIGIRTARYSMVKYRSGEAELYDLSRDAAEMDNVWKDPAYAAVRQDLDAAWWQYKDCAGAACQAPLPASLAVLPAENASLGTSFWAQLRSIYQI